MMNKNENYNKYDTYTEIFQQHKIWKETAKKILEKKEYWNELLKKYKNYRIVFTGAGTSQFIGDALMPYFFKKGLNVVSIATTDIVSNVENYINSDEKLLLISFARSGNSPESIATFNKVNKIVKNVFHLVITCNKNGALALKTKEAKNAALFLLPDESNDKGFAMTSSYSGMTVSCFILLSLMNGEDLFEEVNLASKKLEQNYETFFELWDTLKIEPNDRIVFLGNAEFKGFSSEGRLKFLELTKGDISTFFEGLLAFRHGPKSILNSNSTVIILMSKDDYTRKYEWDMIKELSLENKIKNLVVLDNKNEKEIKNLANLYINFETSLFSEVMIGLFYIVLIQILSLKTSANLGINPDNPCPTGEVNRVVKGVNIYEET